MTTGNWKITHVHGHHIEHKLNHLPARRHVRLLTVEDEGSRPFSVWNGIAHALKTAPIQWAMPLYAMIAGSFGRPGSRRKFYRYHLFEFLTVYGVVAALTYGNPVKGFLYFGLIYSLVYVISR